MKAKISLNSELTTVIENEDSLIPPITIFAYDLSVERDSKFKPIFTTYAKSVDGGYILYEKTLHKGERGFGVMHDLFKKKEELDILEINRRLYNRIIEHTINFEKAYEEYILDKYPPQDHGDEPVLCPGNNKYLHRSLSKARVFFFRFYFRVPRKKL